MPYTAGNAALFYSEHSAGTLRIRLNGGAESTVASGNTSSTGATLEVGRVYGNNAYCLDGEVGEVVITNASLSQADREKVEGYLAHKWG